MEIIGTRGDDTNTPITEVVQSAKDRGLRKGEELLDELVELYNMYPGEFSYSRSEVLEDVLKTALSSTRSDIEDIEEVPRW